MKHNPKDFGGLSYEGVKPLMTHEKVTSIILSDVHSENNSLVLEYIDNLKEDKEIVEKCYGEVQEEIGQLYEKLRQIAQVVDSNLMYDTIKIKKIKPLVKDISRE